MQDFVCGCWRDEYGTQHVVPPLKGTWSRQASSHSSKKDTGWMITTSELQTTSKMYLSTKRWVEEMKLRHQ